MITRIRSSMYVFSIALLPFAVSKLEKQFQHQNFPKYGYIKTCSPMGKGRSPETQHTKECIVAKFLLYNACFGCLIKTKSAMEWTSSKINTLCLTQGQIWGFWHSKASNSNVNMPIWQSLTLFEILCLSYISASFILDCLKTVCAPIYSLHYGEGDI